MNEIKKKRGAPKKPNASTINLAPIRITQEQDDKYRAAAVKAKLPLATWIKKILDKASGLHS